MIDQHGILKERESKFELKLSDMNQEYKTWKEQLDDEKKKHSDKISQLEKEAELRQSKLQSEHSPRQREEKDKFHSEGQQGTDAFFLIDLLLSLNDHNAKFSA